MKKYYKLGQTIKVNLDRQFSVVAMISMRRNNYYFTLYLHENQSGIFRMMEEYENIVINDGHKDDIYSKTTQYIDDHDFGEYIDKCKFELSCLDNGIEMYNDNSPKGFDNVQ